MLHSATTPRLARMAQNHKPQAPSYHFQASSAKRYDLQRCVAAIDRDIRESGPYNAQGSAIPMENSNTEATKRALLGAKQHRKTAAAK